MSHLPSGLRASELAAFDGHHQLQWLLDQELSPIRPADPNCFSISLKSWGRQQCERRSVALIVRLTADASYQVNADALRTPVNVRLHPFLQRLRQPLGVEDVAISDWSSCAAVSVPRLARIDFPRR